MASESPDKKKAKRSSKKRRLMDSDHKSERLNSLPWNSSLPASNDDNADLFSLFIGSNELEGGFLALEEIDESEYGLEIPKIELGNVKKRVSDKRKRNKRKNSERNDDTMFDGETVGEPDGKNDGVKQEDGKGQGKLGKTKKNVKKMKIEDQKNYREDEAMEKTARLLEEQEKVERLLEEKGEANERIATRSVMLALIVTPTRELALQVTDHIKGVAKGTIFRVVPIVGGMSTEKQERLLKARPEIVVGTPGRLWELMSGGEIHLVEFAGCIKNKFYNQSQYDEVRSEWSEFVYFYVGA